VGLSSAWLVGGHAVPARHYRSWKTVRKFERGVRDVRVAALTGGSQQREVSCIWFQKGERCCEKRNSRLKVSRREDRSGKEEKLRKLQSYGGGFRARAGALTGSY